MYYQIPIVRKFIAAFAVFAAAVMAYRFYQLMTYDNLPVKPPAECRELCGG